MKKAGTNKIILWLCILLPLICRNVADAQQAKAPRVGFVRLTRQAEEAKVERLEEFRQGLRQLGYVEGQNIALEVRWAEDKLDRLPDIIAELLRLKVDVIVTHGPPGVRTAREATTAIPIVIAPMDDADVAGFVASLARPGGNITGLSFQTGEVSGKLLDLLKESRPKMSRIAVLSDTRGTLNQLKTLQNAALSAGVRLHVLEVESTKQFDTALETVPKKPSGGSCYPGFAALHQQSPATRSPRGKASVASHLL